MDNNMVGFSVLFLLVVPSHTRSRFVQTSTKCTFSTQLAGLYALSKPCPDRRICAAFENQRIYGLGKSKLSLEIVSHIESSLKS